MVVDVGYVGFAPKRRDVPEGALPHNNPMLFGRMKHLGDAVIHIPQQDHVGKRNAACPPQLNVRASHDR